MRDVRILNMAQTIKHFVSIWAVVVITVFTADFAVAAPVLDTVLVLIDKKTEQSIGVFPYERDVYSKGIKILSQLGAREILLKVFLDARKNKSKDTRLANSFNNIPVTLQARIDDSEPNPNPLLPRHNLAKEFKIINSTIRGESGWLPTIEFSQNAKAVGFIDSISPVLFIESYKDEAVGSLYFHALESIYDKKFVTKSDKLYFGGNEVSLNAKGEYNYDWVLDKQAEYISYIDLLEGKIDPGRIAGKYVVLGYNGEKIHQLPTPEGMMNAHIAFYQSLLSVIASIE